MRAMQYDAAMDMTEEQSELKVQLLLQFLFEVFFFLITKIKHTPAAFYLFYINFSIFSPGFYLLFIFNEQETASS